MDINYDKRFTDAFMAIKKIAISLAEKPNNKLCKRIVQICEAQFKNLENKQKAEKMS